MRVEASAELGVGHFMRCLALGSVLQQRGAEVLVASDMLADGLVATLRRANIDRIAGRMLAAQQLDWLIVDHYALDARYETAARATARRIMVIDDLADRPHDCDLLLDQNLFADMETRYRGLLPAHARVLTGPRYALLRAEFAASRSLVRRPQAVHRILISFGGSDPTNETVKTLRALSPLQLDAVTVDVLVGALNPHRAQVIECLRELPGARLIDGTDRMAELLIAADLFIGASGATSWERCCLGVPSIVVAVASNQAPIARALAEEGYHCYLGEGHDVSEAMIGAAVADRIEHFRGACESARRGMTLVDGHGAERVAAAMGGV